MKGPGRGLILPVSTYAKDMTVCRSIKTLRRAEDPATDDEIQAAALQFVRKISGYRVPSRANEDAFGGAVAEVAGACHRLLESLKPYARSTGGG